MVDSIKKKDSIKDGRFCKNDTFDKQHDRFCKKCKN